jgi:type IV secretion system protein VirB5
MSLSDTLKGWIFKTPVVPSDVDPLDPRCDKTLIIGGRRNGETENPYLAARRTWNALVGEVVSQRNTLLIVAILCLLIALAAVGGILHIGSKSKFIPYLVEVDKLGQAVAAGPLQPTNKEADQRIIHASVAEFICDARTVTPDIALQRKAIFRVYSKLSSADPATAKMNEWLNDTEESSPFKRAEKEMVSIEIKSVLQQTPATWQVDWVETTRDRQGVIEGPPVSYRGLVTVYTVNNTPATTEKQLRNNPMSTYVRDFSWSRLQ